MKYNTNKDVNSFIKDMLGRGWKIVSHNKHIKLRHDNGAIINMATSSKEGKLSRKLKNFKATVRKLEERC